MPHNPFGAANRQVEGISVESEVRHELEVGLCRDVRAKANGDDFSRHRSSGRAFPGIYSARPDVEVPKVQIEKAVADLCRSSIGCPVCDGRDVLKKPPHEPRSPGHGGGK